MIDASIEFNKGVLDGLPDGQEQLLDPELQITDFLFFDSTTVNTRISAKPAGGASVTSADVTAQITAEAGKGYDELLAYLVGKATELSAFSGQKYEWKNDSFDVRKGSRIKESIAAKGLRGDKETGSKVEIKWLFTGWNEFKFQGNLEDASIKTK